MVLAEKARRHQRCESPTPAIKQLKPNYRERMGCGGDDKKGVMTAQVGAEDSVVCAVTGIRCPSVLVIDNTRLDVPADKQRNQRCSTGQLHSIECDIIDVVLVIDNNTRRADHKSATSGLSYIRLAGQLPKTHNNTPQTTPPHNTNHTQPPPTNKQQQPTNNTPPQHQPHTTPPQTNYRM
ncbi:hypothetical protein J6590_036001 [Homalodisca vitripennis]|nr:hypothetical protein J6590_036001 [Homalodisca vitripennis]